MSFFDDLGKNITSKSQAATAVVKEKADVMRINNSISAHKAKQKDIFTELGKAYYEAHKNDSELEETLKGFFDEIEAHNKEIENLNSELESYKKTVTCPGCGSEVDKGVAYCGTCGYKMI